MSMRGIQQLEADHVFDDGTTLKTLREAISAAALIGMWHVSWEMAHRYGVQNIMCMGCGAFSHAQKSTYISRGGHAIRLCTSCHSKQRTPL